MKQVLLGLVLLVVGAVLTKALWPTVHERPAPPAEPTIIDVSEDTRAAYEAVIERLGAAVVDARNRAPDIRNVIDTVFVEDTIVTTIPCPVEESTGERSASLPVLAGHWYPTEAAFADEYGEESLINLKWIAVYPGEVRTQVRLEQLFTTGPVRAIETGPNGVDVIFADGFPSRSCPLTTKLGWAAGGAGVGAIATGILNLLSP